MQLRKDPITRSWVITGDDVPDSEPVSGQPCPFCPDSPNPAQVVSTSPAVRGSTWSARAVVHPTPLYKIEGDPGRRADGFYDQMSPVGAHEVLVENARHDTHLWQASDDEVEAFLLLTASRIQDLKQDRRFKYVSVFKNYGPGAGQEFEHPNAQLTATTFAPRRVLYELRSGRGYYQSKERCVFCDILSQELQQGLRIVESLGDYVALCPYAPRVPYETWIMARTHDAAFERLGTGRPGVMRDLGTLLRRTLQRVLAVSDEFHLILHTSPNTQHRSEILDYWNTIDEDYHWHIEILPKLASKPKSYSFKEVYYSPVASETAVRRLKEVAISG
ncbi:MAG: hypothetical protein H0X25_05735 [Acidobacteriales bacterium]|nr:hypothetical protein [Terriglobales bacterium]